MKQLKPQDRDRSDVIYQSENQVATYSDILCEKLDEIVYAEHLSPKKGMADYGTDWEEFVDIKKSDMKKDSHKKCKKKNAIKQAFFELADGTGFWACFCFHKPPAHLVLIFLKNNISV